MDTFLVKAFVSDANTSESAQENLMKRYEACNFSDNEEDFISAPACSGCPWCSCRPSSPVPLLMLLSFVSSYLFFC